MKRKNGEGSWGTKTIKGTVYQYYRNQDNKYTYGRTIKEVKEKLKNTRSTSTSSKICTLKSYGLNWLQNVKALELEARTYDEYENIIEIMYIGLRVSEACTLKWEDVDIINRTLHVQSSLSKVKERSADYICLTDAGKPYEKKAG